MSGGAGSITRAYESEAPGECRSARGEAAVGGYAVDRVSPEAESVGEAARDSPASSGFRCLVSPLAGSLVVAEGDESDSEHQVLTDEEGDASCAVELAQLGVEGDGGPEPGIEAGQVADHPYRGRAEDVDAKEHQVAEGPIVVDQPDELRDTAVHGSSRLCWTRLYFKPIRTHYT